MKGLRIRDVRAHMPNYREYHSCRRQGLVTGIAVHHSATANQLTGLSMDDARTVFRYHIETLGWSHGGYHYLVHPSGLVEYALDERVPAFHAGFADPSDTLNLECGQYWNNHLLAVCVLGWFERDRVTRDGSVALPDWFTVPTPGQRRMLIELLGNLAARHRIGIDKIKGHRELAGCRTRCPGCNIDLHLLRVALRERPDDGKR